MSSRRRGGSGIGVVAAFVALGCLPAAPAAHADFDDLLDTVIGAATAGPDVDLAGVPADSDLSDLGVLQDPLSQLDQVLNGSSGSAEAPSDTGTPADGSSGNGAEHDSADGDSTKLPSIPKLSMPGSGSGGNGGGPGGSGGSGSPAGGAAKKANASAANGSPAPRPEALP